MLKDLQGWKEAPLDCVIWSLYQLLAFYCNGIKSGFAGLGEYTLASEYSSLIDSGLEVEYIHTNTPQQIVLSIREGRDHRSQEKSDVKVILSVRSIASLSISTSML